MLEGAARLLENEADSTQAPYPAQQLNNRTYFACITSSTVENPKNGPRLNSYRPIITLAVSITFKDCGAAARNGWAHTLTRLILAHYYQLELRPSPPLIEVAVINGLLIARCQIREGRLGRKVWAPNRAMMHPSLPGVLCATSSRHAIQLNIGAGGAADFPLLNLRCTHRVEIFRGLHNSLGI
jgi:hypothetical protein